MAVVLSKPLGRSISLLSKDRIISCRNSIRRDKILMLPESNLSFFVKSDIEKCVTLKPVYFTIGGEQSEKQLSAVNSSSGTLYIKELVISVDAVKKQAVTLNPLFVTIKFLNSFTASEFVARIDPISFKVDDVRSFGANANKDGGNVKKIELTMQQQSFYEIKIDYSAGKVVHCNNLPSGLILENGKIKGAPIYSGRYVVEAVLDNYEINNITINVTPLPRTL